MSLFQKDGEDAIRCCHIGCNTLIGRSEWEPWRDGGKSDWYNLLNFDENFAGDYVIIACPEHASQYAKIVEGELERKRRRQEVEDWYVERARKRILAAFDARYPEATEPDIQSFFIEDGKF